MGVASVSGLPSSQTNFHHALYNETSKSWVKFVTSCSLWGQVNVRTSFLWILLFFFNSIIKTITSFIVLSGSSRIG